jgi:hypothetical protein
MKNKLTILFSILAILSLLVIGATQQGCNKSSTGPNFNTTGLSLAFIEQAPKNQINIGTPFQIYVKTDNMGSYPIEAGTSKFYLTGIGNNIKNVYPIVQNQERLVEKTSQQDGGSETIKFAEAAEPAIIINNPFNFSMRIDACYPYSTSTQATICIGSADGSCIISGEKIFTGSNTNAPIQITSLTEQVQGNRLYIAFLIENKGQGNVYDSNFDCDKFFGADSNSRIKEELKKNKVEVSVDPGNEDIKCSFEKEGKTGTATIGHKVTCSKIVGQQTYPTILKINLAYKYINGISKQITFLP